MTNFRHAPTKITIGAKQTKGKTWLQIPKDVFDFFCNRYGNSSAKLRVMFLHIGTADKFRMTNKFVEDSTKIAKRNYLTVRDKLCNDGYLVYNAVENTIAVNYDKIYADMITVSQNSDDVNSDLILYKSSV